MALLTIRRETSFARAVLAIAATYVYFLLFAQFAFLTLLQERLPSPAWVQGAMAGMGVGGLVTSFAVAALLAKGDARRWLRAAFVACAAVAVAAPACRSTGALSALAVSIGVVTAVLTVTLASHLRALVGGRGVGLSAGLGTGLAYFICNLPPLFDGSPQRQSAVVAAVCLLAAAFGLGRSTAEPPPAGATRESKLPAADLGGLGFLTLLVSFLFLVWLDSAAFAVIQETLELKGQTWGGGGRLLLLGTVHLLAAVLAGWLAQRGALRSLLAATFALFTIAFGLFARFADLGQVAGMIYATGISIYSVALVAYPGSAPDRAGSIPIRWRAGLLFGIAGWLGSALGVGMAQDLHRIPQAFMWGAGAWLLVSWAIARRASVARLARVHGWSLAAAALATLAFVRTGGEVTASTAAGDAPSEAVARGRAIYVEEGCIHCHSQYVRPATRDVRLWGPHQPVGPEARPPLIGYRRQGPDLSTAGIRRSETWHRLHLEDPRSLSPSSRMPSYAHLFEGSSERGQDLLRYLASLGSESGPDRYRITASYPQEPLGGGDRERGQALFSRHCSVCHGARGEGDGRYASEVFTPAMNLTKDRFVLVSWGPGLEPLEVGLARAIKFGMPKTSMPGHETLSQPEIRDLVAFVRSLPRERPTGHRSGHAGAAAGRGSR